MEREGGWGWIGGVRMKRYVWCCVREGEVGR
jgi:hypothetical protein